MKRKIACFAAVFCLLLSAVYLPCAVLAEEEGPPSTETVSPDDPSDETLIPVDVALTLTVSGDRVDVTLTTSDGVVPLGLPVVLAVDGVTAAEGIFIDGDLTLRYVMQPGDRVYRVYTENFALDGKLYQAAMTEQPVDYDDYFIDTDFFRYEDFHFDRRTGQLSLTWNHDSFGNAHGADISAVLVDGKPAPFTGSQGSLSADLSGFPNGVYALQFTLSAGNLSAVVDMGEVSLSCDITPTLTATSSDGTNICVTVTDKWGNRLADIPVTMRVGGTDYLPVRTDADGNAWFTKPAGAAKVSFISRQVDYADYSVLVGTVLFGGDTEVTVPPVVSDSETTSTTVTTRPPVTTGRTTTPVTETTSREPTVTASPTTGVSTDGMVAMGVTYEQVLESLLGVTAEQMTDYGRLFMAADLYDLYVSDTRSSLSLFLRAQEFSVSDSELHNALRAGNIGQFAAKDAYSVCVGMSLLLTEGGSSTEMPVLNGTYVVQLPVPEGLQTADACAVAYYSADGLQKAITVTPVDGYIRFATDSLGTYVLVGLYEGAQGGGLFWPILLIVFGCLLIVCGALLVWLRVAGASVVAGLLGGKPAAEVAEEAPAVQPAVPLTEEVIPAAPAEVDEVIAQATAPVAAAEEEYEDIFSSAERRDAFNHREE